VLIAEAHWFRCRIRPMEEALQHALRHVRPGNRHAQLAVWNAIARAALAGRLPVPEAIERCHEIEAEAPADRTLRAVLGTITAYLEAMRGRFDTARDLYASSQAILAELGQVAARAALQTWSGAIELLAGDAAAAEAELRAAFETLDRMGDKQNLATIAASLAAALHAQARDTEAAELTVLSESLASGDDVTSQIEWRAVRAAVFARESRTDQAQMLAREAVSLARETDCPNLQGNALLSLAETLEAAERTENALDALRDAGDAYAAKGNTVMATVAASRIEALGPSERAGVTSLD
jgi:ATP/maltotriose-dependent transcriptional regulator MalT